MAAVGDRESSAGGDDVVLADGDALAVEDVADGAAEGADLWVLPSTDRVTVLLIAA